MVAFFKRSVFLHFLPTKRSLLVLPFVLLHNLSLAATCPANLGPSNTPTSDFQIHGDGTVTHVPTGLMWKRCLEGRSGSNCDTASGGGIMGWPEALTTARDSTFAGYSDWRLPNLKEAESIVDRTCHSPAINEMVFPGTKSEAIWTGTSVDISNPLSAGTARIIEFTFGRSYPNFKFMGTATRLVRGGQNFDALPPLVTQTLTFGITPSLVVGNVGSLTASSAAPNSGNAIIYTSLSPAVCRVSGTSIIAVSPGTCTVSANQAGDASFKPAAQITVSFEVQAAPIPALSHTAIVSMVLLMLVIVAIRARLLRVVKNP